MVGYFQKYIHIKTPALHFNFEMCSAQFIQRRQSLLENLFVVVSFDIVTINNSMYGKHWALLQVDGHNLSDNNNNKNSLLILMLKCHRIISNAIRSLLDVMTTNVMKEKFEHLQKDNKQMIYKFSMRLSK